MTDTGTPVRRQTTRLLAGGKTKGYGTLLLYPDKLAAVSSRAVRIGMIVGAIVVFGPSLLIPPNTGPGALGALIGVGGVSDRRRYCQEPGRCESGSRGRQRYGYTARFNQQPRDQEVQGLARWLAPYCDDSGRGAVRIRREAGQVVGRSRQRLDGTRLRGSHHTSGHGSRIGTQHMSVQDLTSMRRVATARPGGSRR